MDHEKRERITCEFEVGSAEDLPYPDGYFDKVVCSSLLEHFKGISRHKRNAQKDRLCCELLYLISKAKKG